MNIAHYLPIDLTLLLNEYGSHVKSPFFIQFQTMRFTQPTTIH